MGFQIPNWNISLLSLQQSSCHTLALLHSNFTKSIVLICSITYWNDGKLTIYAACLWHELSLNDMQNLFVNDLNKDIWIIIEMFLDQSKAFSVNNLSTMSKKIFTRYTSLAPCSWDFHKDYPHSKLDDSPCNDAINPQIPDQIQQRKINTSHSLRQIKGR